MSKFGQVLQCRTYAVFLLGSTALILTACGGGGGGGGSSTGTVASFQTEEFLASEALQQINAAEGYARIPGRVGGGNVTVAIIDDGIDADHFDLDDQIVADLEFPGEIPADFPGEAPDGHGTAVGGVIAAERNGQGVHGVAFDANLVSIDALSFDPDSVGFDQLTDQFVNIATGIRIAAGLIDVEGVDAEADIINMSLGIDAATTFQDDALTDAVFDVNTAMQEAAREGKIIVVAAGNEIDTEPSAPAFFVNIPDVAGLGIAVGSIDANNNQSSFSNDCGSVAQFCLVAPGRDVETTLVDNQFGPVIGTSFSAPLVAGSAAVVKAAFPGIGNRDVVSRLLTTAEDLGAVGTDAVFGRGALDLEAALAPVGQLGVSLSNSIDGNEAALSSSQISLGSSAALGSDAEALLERAVALDEQNFPFAVDLRRSVDQRSRITGLDGFIAADRNQTSVQTTEYGSVALAFGEDQRTIDPYRAEFEESDVSLHEQAKDPRVRFESEASERLDLFMSLNETSTTNLGIGSALAEEQGTFFQQSAFLAPYDRLAGLQSGGGGAYELGEQTKVAISAFSAANEDALTQVNLQKVELMHQTAGDIELRVGYGLLQEEGGFLGSSTAGAFGTRTATDTQYFNASLVAPVTDKVSLFGAYSQGRSSTSSASASLLNDFSATSAEAFGAGLVMKSLVDDGDGLSVMVGQPLRVSGGSADITVPVGRTEEGGVLTETARTDLTPDAREITTEAVYRFALDDSDQDLSTGAFVRFNPDHDPNASPDVGFGVKYRLRF